MAFYWHVIQICFEVLTDIQTDISIKKNQLEPYLENLKSEIEKEQKWNENQKDYELPKLMKKVCIQLDKPKVKLMNNPELSSETIQKM